MWKPMLDFTSHVERRAGERPRRRRKRVKTPLNPRVRSVDLSARLSSQENTGVSQLCSVKWVSPQFVGCYASQSQNSTETQAASSLAQPCNTRRLETKGKCTRKTSKAPPAEMRMLFPPRTRPAKCRGIHTGAERREGKLGRAGTRSRFPLDEIDDNSIESLGDKPFLKYNDSHFNIQTCSSRGTCSTSVAKSTRTYTTTVDPPQELPTASSVCCKTSSDMTRRKVKGVQAAQKSELYCKTDGSSEEGETNRGLMAEQKSPSIRTQTGRHRVDLSPSPSHIEDLSSLMECTSISTTPQDGQRSENPSRNSAATIVAIVQQPTPLAQSSVFDVTSFQPPTTSTPLRSRQLRLVDASGSGGGCIGEQTCCDYNERVRGRENMSPLQLCLKEPMSKCREKERVVDIGRINTVLNSQAIHKSHCENEPVIPDQSKGRQLLRHSEMNHKASQADSKLPLSDDSTTMMAYGEHDFASMSTCAYTSLLTPLKNSDICSPLSPAPVLAPETPLEYWGTDMRCRTASAFRGCCAVNESSAVESVQDSYTSF